MGGACKFADAGKAAIILNGPRAARCREAAGGKMLVARSMQEWNDTRSLLLRLRSAGL